MSMIKVTNLTFSYDDNEYIFENVNFNIDDTWKLGFIGRNGQGKTTFLNILLGKLDYSGSILSKVQFEYFPFKVEDENKTAYEIARIYFNDYEIWKLIREINLLDMNEEVLKRPFSTLSKGEQTKVLLAILFLKENKFLLIDEPTNHLDILSRQSIANYLRNKHGFILVSHDRNLIDACVDHVLSINRTNIEIEQGNFSSWYENKKRQDAYELGENEKYKKEIKKLEASSKRTMEWANKVESSKYHPQERGFIDRGYIGHKSAKMMKRATSLQSRKEKAIDEKSKLLKNIEIMEDLKLTSLNNYNGKLIEVNNLSISYQDKNIMTNISFTLELGERLQLKGKNGCGKSSILKLLLGDNINYNGYLYIKSGLKVSYVSQDTSHLHGTLKDFITSNSINEVIFKSILRKLDFARSDFDKKIETMSEGEKKKLLIAKSLCEEAHVYIWDEPLNYIDVFSRMQIEDVLLKFQPTMIFVEHDEEFSKKIATKVIQI